MKQTKKIPMKCKDCGYEWETKSQLAWVCCPSCRKKNKIVREE